MFKHQLATQKGRQIKRAIYDSFIAHGCNPAHAVIAAEAMALETENSSYHRTDSDKRAINNCWQTLTGQGSDELKKFESMPYSHDLIIVIIVNDVSSKKELIEGAKRLIEFRRIDPSVLSRLEAYSESQVEALINQLRPSNC